MNIKRWRGKITKKRGRVINMATQLAPTPVLYGVEARDVLNELNRQTSKESIEKGNKLINFFKKIEKK